jgi:hypothetical protein
MVVLDRGTSTSSQDYQTLWHLPADQKMVVNGNFAVTARPGDRVRW